MRANDVCCSELLRRLIWDPLQLVVFHLSRDGLSRVVGRGLVLILEKLLLNLLNCVINSETASAARVSYI